MDLRDRLQSHLDDRYIVHRELGGGGMSQVFLATERALERKVVIKVLATDLAATLSTTRFEREIRLAASLQQANIVPLLTAGVLDGIPYYTMPFVEGESLRARLASGPLVEAQVVHILRDVTRALDYAHGRGIVHRDIKPDNVLLSGEAAVVTDFGIAKAVSEAQQAAPAPGATGMLTQIGTAIGTPAYMAPEQATADPAMNHRADLYAMGCMAYELLTAVPPFHDKPPHKIMAAHLIEEPPPIAALRPGVDPALAAIVMACMAKDPDERPQTARDVLRQLDALGSSAARDALPTVLAARTRPLSLLLALWTVIFFAVWILARAAVVGIGLPSWTVTLALAVAALGLPAVLVTWFVQRTARQALFTTPVFTTGGNPAMRGTMVTMALKASPYISWSRTRRLGIGAAMVVVVAIGGVMVLRQFGIGPAASLLAAGRIDADSRVLVAQFTTTAADTSLGSVIAQALRTSLGQSDAIRLVSPADVAAGLRRMTLPPSTPLTEATARELAARDGIPLLVTGTVAPLGTGFVVNASLIRADSGTVLASVQGAADGASALLGTLDQLARDLRSQIGESLRAVARAPRLEEATTSSLEALREYTRGVELGDVQGKFTEGAEHLRTAVEEDSTFASAWRKLAVYVNNMNGRRSERVAAAAQAYRYRERVEGVERATIDAYYLEQVNSRQASRVYASSSGLSQNNHIGLLRDMARFAESDSVAASELAAAAAGGRARIIQLYLQAIYSKLALDRMDQARTLFAEMERYFPKAFYTDLVGGALAWAAGGTDSLPRVATALSRSPILASVALAVELDAATAAMRGQLTRHAPLAARASALADSAQSGRDALQQAITVALIESLARQQESAGVRRVDSLRASNPERGTSVLDNHAISFATAYATLGAVDKANQMIAEFTRMAAPQDRLARWGEWHMAIGETALAAGKPVEALAAFRTAVQSDSGRLISQSGSLWPERMGRTFDALGQRDSAVVYFERYRFRTGASYRWAVVHRALILRRLGALYADLGEATKARGAYQEFLSLWRDADRDLQPQVADVRARLATLGK